MITLDKPPASPIWDEPDSWSREQLRRCTLCLSSRPVHEMVQINSSIVWCAVCALRHPELVLPATDVLWPVCGFLIGAFLGWAVSSTPASAQLVMVPGSGVWSALVGLAVGLGLWVIQAWRSTL
jgi:hypothetical protein